MKSVEVPLALGFGSGRQQAEAVSYTTPAAFLLPEHTHHCFIFTHGREWVSLTYRPEHPPTCPPASRIKGWRLLYKGLAAAAEGDSHVLSRVVSTYVGNGGDKEHDDSGDVNHKDTSQ